MGNENIGLLSFQPFSPLNCHSQLLQQLKKLICDLCRLYNLPQHPDVEMLDQPLPAGPVGQDRKASPQVGHVINGCGRRGTGPKGISPLHFIHELQVLGFNLAACPPSGRQQFSAFPVLEIQICQDHLQSRKPPRFTGFNESGGWKAAVQLLINQRLDLQTHTLGLWSPDNDRAAQQCSRQFLQRATIYAATHLLCSGISSRNQFGYISC